MTSPMKILDSTTAPLPLNPSMQLALAQLLEAYNAARTSQRPKWDYAVEIHFLKDLGPSDIRFLICHGLVEHAVEKTRPGAKARAFRKPACLRLLAASCFVL